MARTQRDAARRRRARAAIARRGRAVRRTVARRQFFAAGSPRWRWNRRRSWRSPRPNHSARVSTLALSRAPASIRPRASETVLELPRQKARSGEVSGRQRRQGRKRRGGGGEEAGVGAPGRWRRAERAAIDPGRGDRDEQPPIETMVAGFDGAVAGVVVHAGVDLHAAKIAHVDASVSRFSDVDDAGGTLTLVAARLDLSATSGRGDEAGYLLASGRKRTPLRA